MTIDRSPIARAPGLQLLPVVDGVWCVQRTRILSCSYVVLRPSGVILVDAGIDANGADVRFALAHLERSVSDVHTIFLTHWHNDHSGGAAAIRSESGARVVYHADGEDRFTRTARARGARGWLARRLPAVGTLGPLRALLELAPPAAIEADRLVRDGDVEEGLRVVETPGHEHGHVSYFLEQEGVLFSGDALAVAGDRVSFMSRFLTADVEAARASMLRCIELRPRVICPGHRYPLAPVTDTELGRVRGVIAQSRRWPIVGC